MKTPEELTADWKSGRLASGLYYVGNDKVKDFAFVRPNEISVYTLDSKIPMLLRDNTEILAPVPTYDEYKAMQAELDEFKRTVTSYVDKPIDYDIACETVNKLLDNKEQLKKELESACWYQTILNEDIGKLRGLLRECKTWMSWAYAELYEYNPEHESKNTENLLTRINAALDKSEA